MRGNNCGRTATARGAALAVLTVVVGGALTATRAQDRLGPASDSVSVPIATVGLVAGDGLRTTVTNRGVRGIEARSVIRDVDGAVVKEDTIVVLPGQSHSVAIERAEVLRSEPGVTVRSEIVGARPEVRDLFVTAEVIDWTTGRTRFIAGTKTIDDTDRMGNFEIQQLR